MTVGPGISPDLLTLRHRRKRSRARPCAWAHWTYRRWGIAPRPEDVYCLVCRRAGGRIL